MIDRLSCPMIGCAHIELFGQTVVYFDLEYVTFVALLSFTFLTTAPSLGLSPGVDLVHKWKVV